MSFKHILGQGKAISLLQNLLNTKRLPPALLFSGPDGIGKSMAAFEFAKALNCTGASAGELGDSSLFPAGPASSEKSEACGTCEGCMAADKGINLDIKRLNAVYQAMLLDEEPEKQQTIKIESIRSLVKDMEMRSLTGRWKIAIVEDAHKMMPAAANALLKALEEPPPRSLWVLVTARKNDTLPTIVSRCHTIYFRSLPKPMVESILIQRGIPAKDAGKLAVVSEGSPGKALELQAKQIGSPEEWTAIPLGPIKLVEELPRELHLARPIVEIQLHQMAWHLRLRLGPERLNRRRAQRAFRQLDSLRRALRSNADPKLVLELAAIETQAVDALISFSRNQ